MRDRWISWPSGAASRCSAGIVISLLLCSCAELPGESQTRHYPTRADAAGVVLVNSGGIKGVKNIAILFGGR